MDITWNEELLQYKGRNSILYKIMGYLILLELNVRFKIQ